jgi:hypothetical protein
MDLIRKQVFGNLLGNTRKNELFIRIDDLSELIIDSTTFDNVGSSDLSKGGILINPKNHGFKK